MYWPLIGKIITILFLVSFTIGIIFFFIGVLGIISSIIKKTSKSKWIKYIARGLLITIITFIVFFILNILIYLFFVSKDTISSSFTGDTEVLTPNGRERIENLKKGSKVITYNTETKTTEIGEIEVYRFYETKEYYLVNDTIKVTSEHPFAIVISNKIIWKVAKELTIDDQLLTSYGNSLSVKSVQKVILKKPIIVYNPQVSNDHNYFVVIENTAVLVHNKLPLPQIEEEE